MKIVEKMDWIDAKKKKPKPTNWNKFGESDYVLCQQRDFSPPFVGWYNSKVDCWIVAHHFATNDPISDVTHWMPLPEPPSNTEK